MICLKRIAVITGSRSEYGLLKPLLEKLKDSDDLQLQIIVTGTHLMKQYGYSADEILADGFAADASVPMYIYGEKKGAFGRSIGIAVIGITKALSELKSDLVVVFGDRAEAFAGAVAAMSLNLPIAHLSGGEVTTSGHVDEQIRHAITKMAHLHFPATLASAKRIERMGEELWRIFPVGDPGISILKKMTFPSKNEVFQNLCLDTGSPLALCVQHPVSTQTDESGTQMKITLDVLQEMELQTVIVYPNGDTGSREIVREIELHRNVPFFRIFNNLPRDVFLGIMKNADVMVGNSSSGFSEAPSFGLGVVNVGIRENAREHSGNIISVPHDSSLIRKAIENIISRNKEESRQYANPYEGPDPASEITRILEQIDIDSKLMIKEMTY